MVLFQNDPLRDVDAVLERLAGRGRTVSGTASMAMDAYRRGDNIWVHLDLPGVSAESIDVDLERNVLTVSASREWPSRQEDQMIVSERHQGSYTRQVHLGDSLDAERIEANYVDGVLTLCIPIAARAQPRKITVNTRSEVIDVGDRS